MNYVDIGLLAIIIIYAVVGFYKGALRSIIGLVGSVLIILIAYYLKDPVANYLIKDLPFIKMGGIFELVPSINLLMYKVIAFVSIYAILKLLLMFILKVTRIIDKIIKKSVIFELPSKIIGTVLGLLKGVVIAFIVAFLMSFVGPTQKYAMESKVAKTLLDKTPIMNSLFEKSIKGTREIYKIIEDTGKDNDKNQEIINSLINNDLFSKEDITTIISKGFMGEDND